jgi:SAM-dependent methyltransferase
MQTNVADNLLVGAELLTRNGFRNVPVTPESHRRVNARPEHACAIDLAGVFGWSRRFDPSVLPIELFEVLKTAEAIYQDSTSQDGTWWRSRYRFSTLGGLSFLHSAYPTDGEDAVFFGPDTYRFVTAIQSELAQTNQPWLRAADIGCGSGAAGIYLARQNPAGSVLLTDINANAIDLSKINARLARADNVLFNRGSLLDDAAGSFDLIVANPPYLMDVRKRTYRHGGGERGEGLSLQILDTALNRLAPGGRLLLYTGSVIVDGVDYFFQEIEKRLSHSSHTWTYREIDPDVFGEELDALNADRIAAVLLSVRK